MKSNWLLGLVVAALVLFVPMAAHAQISTGDIYGVVMDETGGVLPGVTVNLTGNLIGSMNQTTGINGDFHFIRLSPGDYDLECVLEGFATYVQKQITVQTGGAVNLKLTMKPTTVAETITVTAEQPILDTKKTGVGQNVTQEILANIPTSRDPWVVLSMVSGIAVDRVNIAGSEGGQQSEFTSRGDVGGDNSMWNMDGVTITDMGAVGSSPTYYDFDAFEEIQVTTGGNDPSQATGGMGVNFVTKRGGDVPKGSARFYTTSEGLQGDNTKDLISATNPSGATTLEGFFWNPKFGRNLLVKSRDYGIEIGGPIVKEKAWYWGAVGLQDIQVITAAKVADTTQLENVSFKVNTQLSQDTSLTYMFYRGDKIKRGRNAGATRPTETTWNQKGPTNIHKIEASYIINPNLYLNGKLGIIRGGFGLSPNGGMTKQVSRDADGVWHGSYEDYITDRPQMQAVVESNYFTSAMGGNHEFKFGFSYRQAQTTSNSTWPGNGVVADSLYGYAWVTRASVIDVKNKYVSFWAGDTITRGRLTANLGFRFDKQTGEILGYSQPANPMFPAVLPAYKQTAAASPFNWSDFSPRLGMTYDLTGDGKTLIRGSFARYADQLSAGQLQFLGIGYSEIDYLWNDVNGNGLVDAGEVDFDYGPVYISAGIDPLDPTSGRNTTVVDANLTAPKRTEFIIGGEREIMPNFSVGGNFVYRKLSGDTWRIGTDYKNPSRSYGFADYVPVTATGKLPDGTPYTLTYYKLNAARAGLAGAGIDTLYSNRPDYNEKYQGIEIFATKRLSNKWMVNASFNYQRDRAYYPTNASMSDPTNEAGRNGDDISFQSASSGKNNLYVTTPAWQFVLNGMYQLPKGVSVSGNMISREGIGLEYIALAQAGDPGNYYKFPRPLATRERKLPKMVELDLRLSKAISLGDKGNINLDLDIFNVLNKNTPLNVEVRLYSGSRNRVTDLLYPRTVRLGLRYSF